MPRRALYAIAAGGLLLRLWPLLRTGGPLVWPVDYDEAVYFSASALLFKGVLPYRDFVFVHPPGLIYFLGLTSSLVRGIDAAHAFAAARVVATLVGAVNIVLIGRIAARAAGPVAGLVAAALYATYPDVVIVERGPYLEPVLNLACLALALVWLSQSKSRPLLSGILCGAACAVKVWGGVWLLAALTSATKDRLLRFLAAAAVTGVVLVAPFLLASPHNFIEQTLLFHAWRPPDGTLSALARLPEIVKSGHLAATILAVVGLFGLRTRDERFFAAAAVLTVAGFFASSSYWSQYNSHLAASECALAGIGAARMIRWSSVVGSRLSAPPRTDNRQPTTTTGRSTALACAVFVAAPSLWIDINALRARSPELLAVGRTIREAVPPGDCVFSFDPVFTLAGGRLPPHGDGAPVIVDSYGAMLLSAVRHDARFRDAAAAFQSPAAQPEALARLRACRFAILGWRGNWELSEPSRAWFRQNFVCVTPNAGDLCLWERWGESHFGLAVAEPGQTIDFGDGWFAEEGTPQQAWRWMAARSVTSLPPLAGLARLELAIELPALHQQAITVALDGRVIDRFRPASNVEVRTYDVGVGGSARHELVLSTDWTLNPAQAHLSSDARDLGVRLNRIVWLRARGGAATSSPP